MTAIIRDGGGFRYHSPVRRRTTPERVPLMRLATTGLAAMILALMFAPGVQAQPQHSGSGAGASEPRRPYDLKSFGAYRAVLLAGDFSAKVGLAAAVAHRPSTGVGAVSDARGEITIHDGRLIVSYGKPSGRVAEESETAALLAVATAPAWQTITLDNDVAPEELDGFLARVARDRGLDPEGPFPFQARGTVAPYIMHVNAAPTNGPHGMGHAAAITVESKGDAIAGAVAGIFVSPDLVGVVSHGGTRTHSHWVAPDGSATAHLDRWGLKAGTVLSLPAR